MNWLGLRRRARASTAADRRLVYPEAASGRLLAPGQKPAEGEVVRLRPNRWGKHGAWVADAPGPSRGLSWKRSPPPVELIPWLLFNRALWVEAAEALPPGETAMQLDVQREQPRDGDGPLEEAPEDALLPEAGWQVGLSLNPDDLTPTRASVLPPEAIRPGGLRLPPGGMPPDTAEDAAAFARSRGVRSAGVLALCAASAATAQWAITPSAADRMEARRLQAEISTLYAEAAADREAARIARAQGLPPGLGRELLLAAWGSGADLSVDPDGNIALNGKAPGLLDCGGVAPEAGAQAHAQPTAPAQPVAQAQAAPGAVFWRACQWR